MTDDEEEDDPVCCIKCGWALCECPPHNAGTKKREYCYQCNAEIVSVAVAEPTVAPSGSQSINDLQPQPSVGMSEKVPHFSDIGKLVERLEAHAKIYRTYASHHLALDAAAALKQQAGEIEVAWAFAERTILRKDAQIERLREALKKIYKYENDHRVNYSSIVRDALSGEKE